MPDVIMARIVNLALQDQDGVTTRKHVEDIIPALQLAQDVLAILPKLRDLFLQAFNRHASLDALQRCSVSCEFLTKGHGYFTPAAAITR
jgi:hypothetical protein